ncbi:flagellar biosynthesis protein FlhA [Blastopirellula sp. JC732]|uniref:Flagellar biosynthesis protein FlhA n=1 Tax=Blastopirellula sediminis TaxID=2894196 RepID=A0A9X1SFK8_9BACT|nr:FHIPEP family type III secretion protein [Blastopirellula sediminis]MCC9607387.1 flagellar biosynthesis protein FlhA [Blastopirellula sediminis]MCC9629320.1 flagellar biosynthesis protein FlhA [Blastopirellula sediminis]
MDYSSILSRYIGREVCVSTFGHIKLRGEVAAIYDDCVRLINASTQGDADDVSWSVDGDHHGQEALVHFHHIVAISCGDEELLDIPVVPDHGKPSWFTEADEKENVVPAAPETSDPWRSYLEMDRLTLEVGPSLVSIISPESKDFFDRMTAVRCQLADSLGIVVPKIRMRDSRQLGDNEYRFLIDENEIARARFGPGRHIALDMGTATETLEGTPGVDPTFGGPGIWIRADQQREAEKGGYLVIEPGMLLVTHLQETLRRFAHEMLTLDDVRSLIEMQRDAQSAEVEELRASPLSLSTIHAVLVRLLEEQVSIKNFSRILETLVRHGARTGDIELLVAAVRVRLGRQICQRYLDRDGRVHAIGLEPELEERLLELNDASAGRKARPWVERLMDNLIDSFHQLEEQQQPTALVTSIDLRSHLWRMMATHLPRVSVLSFAEIPRNTDIYWEMRVSGDDIGLPEGGTRTGGGAKPYSKAAHLIETLGEKMPRQPR